MNNSTLSPDSAQVPDDEQPHILDGTTPLWASWRDYVRFTIKYQDEIYRAYRRGDENADLMILAIRKLASVRDDKTVAILMIATERYIHDYHPDIAQIAGGYAKDDDE